MPVHPADFALGDIIISGVFWRAGGRPAAPVCVCPVNDVTAAATPTANVISHRVMLLSSRANHRTRPRV
jgi:hypothetical protein